MQTPLQEYTQDSDPGVLVANSLYKILFQYGQLSKQNCYGRDLDGKRKAGPALPAISTLKTMLQAGNFSSYKAICCDSDEKIQITLSAQNIFHNVWKILDTQPERYFWWF